MDNNARKIMVRDETETFNGEKRVMHLDESLEVIGSARTEKSGSGEENSSTNKPPIMCH